jgi:hypothetical protein
MDPSEMDHFDILEQDHDLAAELCAIEEGLSEWEIEFVESIMRRVDRGQTLTEKQRDKALSIHRRLI